MGQFKELKSELSTTAAEMKTDMCTLGTGQEALKRDICAELKSDMSKIRADLMTQVHAMENKMGNCMSAIRQELETQISDLSVPRVKPTRQVVLSLTLVVLNKTGLQQLTNS